jgi:VWFA-related protein
VLSTLLAQAGRQAHPTASASTVLNVVAIRANGAANPITSKDISLFDNGVEQTVKNFAPDLSPARIVLLVDNSLTIRADVDKLEAATREFAYEIFDGDKLLIVGYDNNAEIVSDWTDNAKKIEVELKTFRKKGDPHLFDSIMAVVEDALRPLSAQKRAIVVISDGLDRGSKAKFKQALSALQSLDIAVYCVQAQDRTRGAIRRDVPKPRQVIDDLAEGTGGRIFPIEDPGAAAKAICDELRKNRYVLSYLPQSVPYSEARRLLVMGEEGINARAKTMQPPD